MNDKLMGQALIDAVVKHDIITVKQLIKQGVDVEYIDSQNMTALLHCCQLQLLDILMLLVEAGADVHHANNLGHLPVELAHWHGEFHMGSYTATSQKIVKYLVAFNVVIDKLYCTSIFNHGSCKWIRDYLKY
ncbi:ankyrin repeat domain-containing protein [Shewanella sp. SM95]|uniref:ankyrin repeat domain-containing protein n=1 Tax=Shewanella sp. SM95 TaxID=2912812 RepID=UPI0021D9F62F|nr:ankyrin repeat domain-containing protein [Shewanella sp. SM95]MCU7996981.1 ankyrin repeat domain-containing protein [Shewanella sp. SM95]